MSKLNRKVNFSVANISIITPDSFEGTWIPSFKFRDFELTKAVNVNQELFKEEVLSEVFKDNVEVVFSHINNSIGLSKLLMWETLYVYINWMYKNLYETTNNKKYLNDLKFITKDVSSDVFGNYIENPFSTFNSHEKRKTCCLAYLSNSKNKFCENCPKI
jgi:ferric iron reductase protein FhuF